MSAECHKHGCDLVYGEGKWPVGACPQCERLVQIIERHNAGPHVAREPVDV